MLTKYKILIATVIVVILLGVLSLYFFYNPSQHSFFPKCPFYSITGFYCPGCGSQRAIHQIINGNIINGIRHNYLILLLALVLSYQGIIYILSKLNNSTYKNILHKPVVTKLILVIVLLFWLFRNFKWYPFTEFAP